MKTFRILAILTLATCPLAAAANTQNVSDLVGEWQDGSVSPIVYRDAVTGSFAPPSGTWMIYTIRANGTYTWAGTIQSTVYGCTLSDFLYREGTFSATATSIKFVEQKSMHRYTHSCGTSDPQMVNDSYLTTKTYSWRIATEDGKTWLLLSDPTLNRGKPGNGDVWYQKQPDKRTFEQKLLDKMKLDR